MISWVSWCHRFRGFIGFVASWVSWFYGCRDFVSCRNFIGCVASSVSCFHGFRGFMGGFMGFICFYRFVVSVFHSFMVLRNNYSNKQYFGTW